MGDAYWRYADARAQQVTMPPLIGKRPRSDYDIPGGHDLPSYFPREDERGLSRVSRDSDALGASYDRYLRGGQQFPPYGGESTRPMSAGPGGRALEDHRMMGIGGMDSSLSAKGRAGLGGGRPEISLPPDASNTLYVEGLPANCSRREVAHIFRPFVGYKEVRLVNKDSRHSGGDPLVLCFVDFESPAEAATAKDALQERDTGYDARIRVGVSNTDRIQVSDPPSCYKFDEHDRDSLSLRIQFARFPGARTGGGHRGRR